MGPLGDHPDYPLGQLQEVTPAFARRISTMFPPLGLPEREGTSQALQLPAFHLHQPHHLHLIPPRPPQPCSVVLLVPVLCVHIVLCGALMIFTFVSPGFVLGLVSSLLLRGVLSCPNRPLLPCATPPR